MTRMGYWMFTICLIYLILGFADICFKFCPLELIQVAWIVILAMPLCIPKLGHWLTGARIMTDNHIYISRRTK
jgi:hypothetical protein